MSDWVTPDPIPNSAVKPVSADDSRKAKVGRRQNHDVFFVADILLILAKIRLLTKSIFYAIFIYSLGIAILRYFQGKLEAHF